MRSGRNAASRVFSVRVVRVLGVVARGNAVNFAAGMATALEAGRCRLREPRVYASRTGLVCGQRTGVCADGASPTRGHTWCGQAQNGAKGAHRGVRRHGARLGGACAVASDGVEGSGSCACDCALVRLLFGQCLLSKRVCMSCGVKGSHEAVERGVWVGAA